MPGLIYLSFFFVARRLPARLPCSTARRELVLVIDGCGHLVLPVCLLVFFSFGSSSGPPCSGRASSWLFGLHTARPVGLWSSVCRLCAALSTRLSFRRAVRSLLGLLLGEVFWAGPSLGVKLARVRCPRAAWRCIRITPLVRPYGHPRTLPSASACR